MVKKYELGDVLTGKVTGIQPYGAFVALDDNTQGLVHISEIHLANGLFVIVICACDEVII